MKKLKYLAIFILPLTVWVSFSSVGILCYLPHFVFFGLLPLLELIIPHNTSTNDQSETILAKKDMFYDTLLFFLLPVQWGFVFYFLFHISSVNDFSDLIGQITSLGFMCGIIGINVGHELGHRSNRFEQFIGELLLLSSLENHFLPYHNSGHHANVCTFSDPATARKNEPIYWFIFRSHFGSYVQAWQFELKRMLIIKKNKLSLRNKMIQYSLVQLILVLSIFWFFGGLVLFYFLLASITGIILLELVNYIEHYGLLRHQRENGTFETFKNCHAWNSNHIGGRVILFELSRHSDHHMKPDKPYHVLECKTESPLMPTGYPGMVLLALIPPLFFWIMNPKVEAVLKKDF